MVRNPDCKRVMPTGVVYALSVLSLNTALSGVAPVVSSVVSIAIAG